MNLYDTLNNKIATALKSPQVANVVSSTIPVSADWMNYHVFDGGRYYIGGMNRGRVPFVYFYRTNSNYDFDAVSSNYDQGGQVTTYWTIEIITGKLKSEHTNESLGYDLAQKIIKMIRADRNLCLGTETISEAINHPFGTMIKIELNIENTHSNSEK